MILMARVMKTRVGDSIRKLILLKLADNADDFGLCRPSYQHISDQCELARRTVIRHVKALEDEGFLLRRKRGRNGLQVSNEFSLNLGFLASLGGSDRESPGSDRESPGSDRESPLSSDRESPGTSHSFEPVREPKEKTSKKKFSPPTFEQVRAYIGQHDLQVCPERFFDHYTANGWKVGRVAMRDWQATLRNWGRKNAEGSSNRKTSTAEMHHDTLKKIAARGDARAMGKPVV